jgi:dihydropteroate synthase-like protein
VYERLLFVTGKLAERSLHRVLEQMQPADFRYTVRQLGVSVAALMTTDMIGRRLAHTAADRVIIPGRCRGDLSALTRTLGVPVERGPDDLKDLPQYFGVEETGADLSRYDVRIFAEIVDAPRMGIAAILAKAAAYRADGADVIDIGGLPNTPFPHLEEVVIKLRAAGYRVSIDSMDPDELRRGARAGADYLLSLTEYTLDIVDENPAIVPVLIPSEPGDLGSLERAMAAMEASGRDYLADPILDPINFGFTDSVARYRELRQRHPRTQVLMGIANVTELMDADTAGINAILMGMACELHITNILTTQVSPHARCAVAEADLARRLMYAAREYHSLPRGFGSGLLALHERVPFPYDAEEIAELAKQVRDPSFRIQVSAAGIHVYNRDGLRTGTDPFALYPALGVKDDASHAFYLGVELGRAEIAWSLGKRFVQDQPLQWGCAVPRRVVETNPASGDGSSIDPTLDTESEA